MFIPAIGIICSGNRMGKKQHIPVYTNFNSSLQKLHLPKCNTRKPFHVFSWAYRSKQPIIYPLARQTYFDLTFFVKAGFEHTLNTEAFSIVNHSLHLITPGQAEYFETDTLSRPAGFGIYFFPEFIFATIAQHTLEQELPFLKPAHQNTFFFSPAQSAELQELFKRMLQEQDNDRDNYAVLRQYLLLLLYKIKQFGMTYSRKKAMGTTAAAITSAFEKALKQNYLRITNIATYARALHITPKQLTNALYLETGKTPKQLLQETILLEARLLLAHSKMNISEIAFHFNFHDVPHFTHFFKKRTGESPQQFRRNAGKTTQ
jgi:AraC family transcriptional regulator, transcriptional activator of pobA